MRRFVIIATTEQLFTFLLIDKSVTSTCVWGFLQGLMTREVVFPDLRITVGLWQVRWEETFRLQLPHVQVSVEVLNCIF